MASVIVKEQGASDIVYSDVKFIRSTKERLYRCQNIYPKHKLLMFVINLILNNPNYSYTLENCISIQESIDELLTGCDDYCFYQIQG